MVGNVIQIKSGCEWYVRNIMYIEKNIFGILQNVVAKMVNI